MSYSLFDHLSDEIRDYQDPTDGALTVLQDLIEVLDGEYSDSPDCEVISNEIKSIVSLMENRDE